ncbi:MAG: hypothetical protein LAN64_01650 [Acidobacteriia bacterium]|nr:hypothetical protein [Terriglobia bacterium]
MASASFGQHGDGNCTTPDISSRPDCSQAIAFLKKLQVAVKSGSPDRVAILVSYPLSTSLHGRRTLIGNRLQFVREYNNIFTGPIRCAILHADTADVWGNYSGFMIGRGAVWWDARIPKKDTDKIARGEEIPGNKYPLKIMTVNNENVLQKECRNHKR